MRDNIEERRRGGRALLWPILTGALYIALGLALIAAPSVEAQEPDYLHAEGNMLVDGNGNRVILTGINWFGLETESFAPHGLWARPWESFLDQIKELGFNTIRLPYSNELLEPDSMPHSIDYDLNPDLEGLSGLEVMDKIIAGAGERGLRVILDRHRPNSRAQSELWYTADVSEERWIADWVMLAKRYQGDDTVIGVDLHNEPHGAATWGSGDRATDWRLAAERAGNAILDVNPHLLVIVQGVDRYEENWYWWGGNLMGAGDYPVRLDVPNRLVYSTHVYGPGVYPQPWFAEPEFPNNLPGIWDRHWGYLHHQRVAPIIVGEFGGRSVGDDAEGVWQRALVSYLREHDLSYFYWTLNPNSGDTGGLLLDDWQTVDPEKQELLSGYQFPAVGVPRQTPEPPEEVPSAAPVQPESLQAQYRNAAPEPESQSPKPEFIINNSGDDAIGLARVELRYWLDAEDGEALAFRCDWAAIGCHNIRGDFEVADGGASYLRLRFTPGAGDLAPGENSGEIKVRFNRSDWFPLQQDEHFSFGPHGEYRPWEPVSLYVGGQRVWGREPGTDTVAPAADPDRQTSATATSITPASSTPETGSPTPQATTTIAAATEEPAEVAAVAKPSPQATSQGPGTNSTRSESAAQQFSTIELIIAAGVAAALVGLGVIFGLFLSRRQPRSTKRP